jgi:hypothetical protein
MSLQKKGSWGGARTGSGRKLQPSQKVMRKLRKYLELTLLSDFKLMAHLALRPEEFADQVQFAGSEKDESTEGKQSQTRTGAYALDPLFKERLSLLRFRLQKFLPDAPKEIEMSGEMEMLGLPPQVVNVLVQTAQEQVSQELMNNLNSCEIPSISVSPSAPAIPTSNGNVISSKTVELLTKMDLLTSQNGHDQSSLPQSTDQEKPKS